MNLDTQSIQIMGIVNTTPDSFYDGGRFYEKEKAVEHALRLAEEGAEIIDIGGESSRPGAQPVSEEEELRRVIPVIEGLRRRSGIPISVDTYKSKVAEKAIEAGANIVNDISALRMDRRMVEVVKKYKVAIVLMHMQGTPSTMQVNPSYEDVLKEIFDFLKERVDFASRNGIAFERIIIDPGIGFGKRLEHNLLILRHLERFKALNRPVLIGVSRKSFIGQILNLPEEERLEGTISAICLSIMKGANILRVHDVKEVRRAVEVAKAIMGR